ncbi:MAG: SatD family protein [Balneolaceae bacterium]|nr:SatD family protein [Balneolaceae bacterium]
MEKEPSLYAVITGDVVDSSKIGSDHRDQLMNTLKASFRAVYSVLQKGNDPYPFDIYRGDSFQGVIRSPQDALAASLAIRCTLRKAQPGESPISWDARTAIGIGRIDYLPEKATEGDGQAYRLSGPMLDAMKTEQRLSITTPWDDVNRELKAESALLDAVIAKWSPNQAETVLELLREQSRKEISEKFGISQAAVHYRVKGAGWFAVGQFLERYREIMNNRPMPE